MVQTIFTGMLSKDEAPEIGKHSPLMPCLSMAYYYGTIA